MNQIIRRIVALLTVATSATTLFGSTLYVTPTGAGNQDGSDWANAFAGIQAAVDAVDAAVAADPDYAIPVIQVADGTYTRVVVTNDLALDVRSVNGAAATVIDGGGTNNCVNVQLGYNTYGQSPTFTGFTLQNGNVRGQTYDRGGGAAGGSLVDCVVQDCEAWQGGGTYLANTMRCVIRRCYASSYGGIAYGGSHVNDLIVGNSGYWAPIYNASLYSSTVADNTAESIHYDFLDGNSTARNCILWNNKIYNYHTEQDEVFARDDQQDPKFVGGGDYHLRAGSPALNDGLEDWQTEAYVGLTDLDGNARVQGAKIDRGCYEAANGQGLVGVLVLASAEGNGTVSPAHSFVNVGATVTITADTSTWHRDVTAWKTNGVVVAGATGNSLTFTATGEQIDVVAQFATLDWFVNGTTGSDTANNGRTASTAFKTIQHAIDCAAPEEQIFVAAGTYAPIDASRANVAIIGDGRDTTIIDGGGTTRCADLGERNFSYLQGFTLRNGRHMNVGTTPGQGEEGTGGGGAKGGFLIDCAIENCHSTFGGGAFHSEIHRSIIRDCSAYEGGGAIFGKYCNCLFDRNWATQGGAASSAELWGCTVVRSRAVDFAAVYVSSAYSTIFWGNKSGNGRTNYWLLEEGECCFEEEMEDYNVSFTGDPLFVDPENGDFRLREDSPCIDCGWGGVLEDEFDVRGAGYPRRIDALHGEEIADMGCYEGGVPLSQIPQPPAPPAPRTIQVSGGGAALQNAINNASDGDTLVVADGIYSAIDARGKVLTIVSANGPAAAIIRGSSTTRAATLSTSMTHPASTLAGFTVEGGTSTDLLYGGGGILGGTVSNCVVRGNSAYCGGGVAQAYVTHSIISNNTATVSGGGACASWLDTCLVVHNAANVNLAGFDLTPWGGGVPAANDNESGGGGIAFSAANFCTITRNTSTTYAGGGMFVVLDNTYIAGNTASGGPAARQNADLFPQYPNHVCATSPNFIDDEGFVNADQDNSLVDPDNGDYRLKATSLCVEGGDTAFVSHRYATDLDGNPRWRGSAPDIGCYEAAGAAPVVVPDVDAWTGPVWEGDEGVLVEWGVSRGAEWYTVHRSTTDDFATATQVGRVDAPTTEFLDATAAISVRYRYWVVAHSTVGDGPVGDSVEGYWVSELVITTPYLPNGLTRELYSTNLAATGGMPPYTWTVETPAWLSVSGNTISGMPRMAGPTTVRVTVEDADGQVDIRSWTLTIENNPAPLGPATPYAGEAYPGNYLIRNFDELRLFEETLRDPAGFDFEGATFTLTADIDCGGRAFAPTNGACSYFKGTFDGQGHVISNYVNNGYSTGSLLGDAGYGAVVKDVTLVGDIRLTTLWDRWGTTALSENSGAAAFAEFVQAGPAADAPPGLTMLNCHFVGTVTNDQSGDSGFAAAGLVAYVSKQGGFDASPVGTVNLRMSNCTVRASVDGREGAGGLVAAGFGIEATDCSVTGGVYRATNIGGLGGFIRRSSFTDCTFDGEVDAIPAKNPAEGG
ncbi:MAG: right-handed parallel beta-helix repeat-containing protein, partial [Kiritimatiellae bacterium]|nr:right-handed parallel beta-helix repeat-containing protein [Kiritimatiellia bacterium]